MNCYQEDIKAFQTFLFSADVCDQDKQKNNWLNL